MLFANVNESHTTVSEDGDKSSKWVLFIDLKKQRRKKTFIQPYLQVWNFVLKTCGRLALFECNRYELNLKDLILCIINSILWNCRYTMYNGCCHRHHQHHHHHQYLCYFHCGEKKVFSIKCSNSIIYRFRGKFKRI